MLSSAFSVLRPQNYGSAIKPIASPTNRLPCLRGQQNQFNKGSLRVMISL